MLDSLSEIRLLAQSSLRYRRQILSMKHFFAKLDATVLLLDDLTADAHDKTVHSVVHGVVRLEEEAPLYGAERRRMRVMKYRGSRYRGAGELAPLMWGKSRGATWPFVVIPGYALDVALPLRLNRSRQPV